MSDQGWSILVVASSGAVSFLTGLTEDMARYLRQTSLYLYWEEDPYSDAAIASKVRERAMQSSMQNGGNYIQLGNGYMIHCDQNQTTQLFSSINAFGPDQQPLVVWPKPDDYEDRLAAAMEQFEVAASINEQIDKRRTA